MDPQTFDAILGQVISGTPVRQAITANSVHPMQFYRAMEADKELGERYARACVTGQDATADDAIRIADAMDIPADHKRIMVEARKWFLAKKAPKKYGDMTRQEITGADGGPLQAQVTVEFIGSHTGTPA